MGQPRLEALAAPLRDLSRWNRLLSMPSDRRSGYLTFSEPVPAVWNALSSGAAIALGDAGLGVRDDWSNPTPVALDRAIVEQRLVRLDALSSDLAEETGISPLSLALGIVLWRDGERVRAAPLMHCPAMLEGEPGAWTLRRFGAPVLNPLLVDRLGIDVSRLLADPLMWRAADLAVYGVIEIAPVAVLGLFDLARYRLWQRVTSGVERSGPGAGAVRRLLAEPTGEPWPQKLIRRRMRRGKRSERLVSLLDRSQMMILLASRRGVNVVVEGGPGSGKTQAIVHIIGNAFRDRRTVLFLSGRQSAFRAVKERLWAKMTATAILDLCDTGWEPRLLVERIGVQPGETIQETLAKAGSRQTIVMATPASLAMHLPRGWSFDLLVVDEASLIPLVEALPAVAACRQLVICGDSQQMQRDPPLHVLFDRQAPHVPMPSLHDVALEAGLPVMRLNFHYRSRHPTLMHYTNRIFYDGRLRMSPGPDPDRELGFRAARIDGTFAWGTMTNAAEAEAVVDALARHVESGSEASVAIIALTMQQRDLIRRRIAERGVDCARISERESLLVADYNGVQGKERDVVFVSLTFGPATEGGAWPTSYGALSLPGGEKRLDVMMTRSRERTLVMTSFPRESIRVGLCLAHENLRAYLECLARPDRDEAMRYEGPLEAILQRSSFRGAKFGNAVGVIDTRTERYVAAIYLTGLTHPLIERSEIAQYENSGWLVIEMAAEAVERSVADLDLRGELAQQVWQACRPKIFA